MTDCKNKVTQILTLTELYQAGVKRVKRASKRTLQLTLKPWQKRGMK
ncbi:MAG: hypothetical protein ACRBHB_09670 [Arenicella sp.]